MTLQEFLKESNAIEGISTEPTAEQIEKTKLFLELDNITVQDVCNIVSTFQPGAFIRGVHGMNVVVGNHKPPPGGPDIPKKLEALLLQNNRQVKKISGAGMLHRVAYKFHCDYETLHPFMDGNGRSGRLLWLWAMGGMRWLNTSPYTFLHTFYYQSLMNYRG